jgi:LuxR family maltose regulon positive regulatory protein
MTDPILTTKLHLPILRKDVVLRGRLVERLNANLWQEDGFVRKLTLVSAPAGFGKTTLVSEWLSDLRFMIDNTRPRSEAERDFRLDLGDRQIENLQSKFVNRVAWFSLDESDNDPVRFLIYLIAALRQVWPEFGRQTEAILQLSQPPPPPVVLTSLVNELSTLPAPFILALDDYHTIHTPSIHQQLTFILEHQPVNMHLVVSTRADPLLPVARLRARGQLLEIRQNDLRFTQEETAEFIQRGNGLSLTSEDLSALEHHTEGNGPATRITLTVWLRRSDDFHPRFHHQ